MDDEPLALPSTDAPPGLLKFPRLGFVRVDPELIPMLSVMCGNLLNFSDHAKSDGRDDDDDLDGVDVEGVRGVVPCGCWNAVMMVDGEKYIPRHIATNVAFRLKAFCIVILGRGM